MKRSLLAVFMYFASLVTLLAGDVLPGAVSPQLSDVQQSTDQRSDRDHLLELIHSVRSEYGITTPLRTDLVADEVSSAYVQTLYTGELKHLDAYGRNSVSRYRQDGGSALSTGEILGRGPNIETIVAYWLKSPTHRQILLDNKWTALGVGIHQSAGFYTLAVLFTTSISEDRSYEWQGNYLSVYVTLREGIAPNVWLQSGSSHMMPNQIKDDKFLIFNVETNGPERVLIFNANGQGDLLVVPARGN